MEEQRSFPIFVHSFLVLLFGLLLLVFSPSHPMADEKKGPVADRLSSDPILDGDPQLARELLVPDIVDHYLYGDYPWVLEPGDDPRQWEGQRWEDFLLDVPNDEKERLMEVIRERVEEQLEEIP